MKFSLEKTFHRITDGFFSTDENESAETSENEISITIDSMDDIDDAIAFMPDLPVPEYIPEGFELEELKASKFVDKSYAVSYIFKNSNNKKFMISSHSTSEEDALAVVGGFRNNRINDRKIYYYGDNYTNEDGASFILSEQLIAISGDLEKKDMIDLAERIEMKN